MIKWRRNDVPLAGPHVDIAESEEICLGSQVSFVTDTQITASCAFVRISRYAERRRPSVVATRVTDIYCAPVNADR
jgi:hypothetical protein